MTGGRWGVGVVVAVVLAGAAAGCVGGPQPSVGPVSGHPDSARLHEQAQAALARWARAAASADAQAFEPVGEMTSQIGDWEEKVGSNNKSALMAGMVEAATALPTKAPPDGQLRWPDGTSKTVQLISASDALAAIKADANGSECSDCVPLRVTAARLTTGPIQTTRGPATGPVWDLTVAGTAVHVTRVAIAGPVSVVPPPWDPNDPAVGIWIESATGTVGGRQLTVTFIGSPGAGDKPCGADYTAEGVESATAVVVIVTEHPYPVAGACTLAGAERTATVDLAAPLGDRAVLEVRAGLPVPVVLSP